MLQCMHLVALAGQGSRPLQVCPKSFMRTTVWFANSGGMSRFEFMRLSAVIAYMVT